MKLPSIALLAALLHFSTTSATPLTTSFSLTPRAQFCANAPNIKAGTHLSRRTLSLPDNASLHPRAPPSRVTWCVGQSSTYLSLAIKALRTAPLIASVLGPASNTIIAQIYSVAGDGPIPQGVFEAHAGAMTFLAKNANNHQLTWGVLKAAIDGLNDYFISVGKWSDCEINIWDGDNWVGQATLSGGS